MANSNTLGSQSVPGRRAAFFVSYEVIREYKGHASIYSWRVETLLASHAERLTSEIEIVMQEIKEFYCKQLNESIEIKVLNTSITVLQECIG